ncbi:Inactive phospholipase C-like protein 2, partial [Dinothrombium tinctorium]
MKIKEISGAYSENCAFSIIYGDDFDSLDLIASTPEEANIWVTGINFLIGANKSSDALESRQKMREKWLQEVFDQADAERKGMLDEWETIAVMKKINSQLCIRQLKQKIMEFDIGKDEEERGRINKKLFVTLFKEIATRPDVYFILVRYCGKDYMSVEDLQLFMEGEQGVCGVTLEDCEQLISKYERSEEARKNKQLLIDGFTQLLLSEECDIKSPLHKEICQDMTQPLSHYFIATSHNTYLLEDQLKGPSSVEGYVKVLQKGCRCVKIDCWDGVSGPVVYHGNTLTSKIPIEDVLRTVNDHAFAVSEFPLIIHLENHCSLDNQKQIASLMKQIFQTSLYIPEKDKACPLNCLQDLRRKILIKGKKLANYNADEGEVSDEDDSAESRASKETLKRVPLCRELSDLVSLIRTHYFDLSVVDLRKENEVSYFNEAFASKLALACAEEFVHHNKSMLTQVAPDVSRVDSSNVNPFDFWNCGCQLVAMNYQTPGQMMDYYRGWFQQNGFCGYVLKPAFLRERFCLFNARRKDSLPGIDPLCIRVKIISGQHLPRPRGASSKASAIDPYVTVQLAGVPADCAEVRTRTISNEGNSPIFDECFEFSVTVPELALLRFVVLDDDYINDDFIGQCTIPIECLQSGYRHVKLYTSDGECLPNVTLFVHVSMTHRYGIKQKLRRKRSWSSKQGTDLRSVGLKQVDEAFKSGSNLINESTQIRKDIERTMVDLCDECSLHESANVAQCLRVFVLRLASCFSVTSFEIVKPEPQSFPTIKICGELTGKLSKSFAVLEKALAEFYFASRNANTTLEMLDESHDALVKFGDELTNLCSLSGIKGRKADKITENFMWNLSVLKTEMDMLRSTKEDCECALLQVERLSVALKRLFECERESITKSSSKEPLKNVDVLISGASLLTEPEPKQPPPLTPTSPNDARLRGILKKSPVTCTDSALISTSVTNNEEKAETTLNTQEDVNIDNDNSTPLENS